MFGVRGRSKKKKRKKNEERKKKKKKKLKVGSHSKDISLYNIKGERIEMGSKSVRPR